MKSLRKLIIAITLLLFMGQSFASLKMACEIPTNSSHGGGVSKHLDSATEGSKGSEGEHHHKYSPEEVSFKQVDSQASCDTDQSTCPCSMGTCSIYYLPVNSFSFDFTNSLDQLQAREDYSSHQSTLLFRPPRSA